MTHRELPKYEVLFFYFFTWLAGKGPLSLGERIRLILNKVLS